jgi:hypothetical protein
MLLYFNYWLIKIAKIQFMEGKMLCIKCGEASKKIIQCSSAICRRLNPQQLIFNDKKCKHCGSAIEELCSKCKQKT